MTSVSLSGKPYIYLINATNTEYSEIDINDDSFSLSLVNNVYSTKNILNKSQKLKSIIDSSPLVTLEETIPFRIKITNVIVPGYSSTNVPGLGVQVIGFSNYIL